MSHTGSRSAKELRALVRERDGDLCSVCGKPIDFTVAPGGWMGPSLEHVIPKAAGGSNELENLRLAHARPCNHAKAGVHDGLDFAAAGLGDGPRAVTAKHERQVKTAVLQATAAWREKRRDGGALAVRGSARLTGAA